MATRHARIGEERESIYTPTANQRQPRSGPRRRPTRQPSECYIGFVEWAGGRRPGWPVHHRYFSSPAPFCTRFHVYVMDGRTTPSGSTSVRLCSSSSRQLRGDSVPTASPPASGQSRPVRARRMHEHPVPMGLTSGLLVGMLLLLFILCFLSTITDYITYILALFVILTAVCLFVFKIKLNWIELNWEWWHRNGNEMCVKEVPFFCIVTCGDWWTVNEQSWVTMNNGK